jgi:SNF2 family DNA or RNA helicase
MLPIFDLNSRHFSLKMALIHGSWLIKNQSSCFFLWGEIWKNSTNELIQNSSEPVLSYPLAMKTGELMDLLRSSTAKLKTPNSVLSAHTQTSKTGSPKKSAKTTENNSISSINSAIVAFPTEIKASEKIDIFALSPIHSATFNSHEVEGSPVAPRQGLFDTTAPEKFLQPWQVEGLYLTPNEAIKFLISLPQNITDEQNELLGEDLRFWSHIARWSLDLISRCKFLPGISQSDQGNYIGNWQALLDSSIDNSRLDKFSQLMPLSSRMYWINEINNPQDSSVYLNFPQEPQKLILDFLNNTIDAQIRGKVSVLPPAEARLIASLPVAVRQWFQGLTTTSNTINVEPFLAERLSGSLKAWTLPLEYQLAGKTLFRTCFELRSPANSETHWTLAYFLQASSDPEFRVDAATIWQHPVEQLTSQNRVIEQPLETFLRGLGLASRLYPAIAESLENSSPEYCQLNPTQAYEFIKSVAWRFENSGLGVILPPSLANRGEVANRLGLKITAQTLGKKQGKLGLQSLLNFQWELAIGGQTISKSEFDKLVALNSPLVEINGEWVELRPQDIKTAQAFFESRKDQVSLSLEDALRLSSGDTQTIEKLPVVSFEATGVLQELVTALTNHQAIETLPIPADFQGELRPYQERGIAWFAFLERWGLGACLADDMGLGKSVQFITFLLHLKEQGTLDKPTLLVCPTSVLGNWEREVKKFAPTLKVIQYHGDKRPKGKDFEAAIKNHDLLLTSYSLIHRDLKLLKTVDWQIIALDEAQNVKNVDSKQSQAVRQLESSFRVALTGTPVENRLQELWSILDFLNPGYLGNKQFFQRRFAMPIEKYGDTASLTQLRSLVQPFILRRLKSDRTIIQDLPEKQEMAVFCGLSVEQAKLYQQVVEDSLAEIETAEGLQRRGMILGLLVKLKQVCNHPSQYLKQSSLSQQDSGKLTRLEEMLDEVLEAGDRALIFTQFAEWGKLLKPYLESKFGREILFLYGSTTKKQREEMIDRFQQDPQGPPIMILSLKAGGVGLNLTRANHVFHFDRWWNPAVENQATDRVFRIGQTRNVQVHKFVCTGTLEEKIHDMIESKKQLADQVVGGGEEWLTEMDTNQLRDLLLLDRGAIIDDED